MGVPRVDGVDEQDGEESELLFRWLSCKLTPPIWFYQYSSEVDGHGN